MQTFKILIPYFKRYKKRCFCGFCSDYRIGVCDTLSTTFT